MPFKKLHLDIKEKLEELEITTPTDFQIKSIPVIKSSSNTFCVAPKDSGKTTTLVLTTLHKLNCEEVGTAPRAFVLVENMEKGLELQKTFLRYTKYASLRVYLADDKSHIDLLKSEIFEGIDVLIATPKTIAKLSLLNGVNMSQLKIFNIDDAAFLAQKNSYDIVLSVTQSITKCQYVVYSEKLDPSIKRLESYFMEYSKIVSL